ncbi:MAG TPA: heavy metal-binding domain-containing protein, partial [Candidatus Acidoferrum sp.]|nr:heavy metal-binding domain-containing protein [Candidatus Acidoferrum sp.]
MQKRIFILTTAIAFAMNAAAQVRATDPFGSTSGQALNPPGTQHDYPPSLRSGVAGQREHEKKQKYTCPMHPDVVANHPGNCPKCGMKLVPITQEKRATPTQHPTSNNNHMSHQSHSAHEMHQHPPLHA